MVLRCECGGAVELTDATHGADSMTERYQCVACGQQGTYMVGPHSEAVSGCLTRTAEVLGS